MDERADVFEIVNHLDDMLSNGRFDEADAFYRDAALDAVTNPCWLLAAYNYLVIAERHGDGHHLQSGSAFKIAARQRLVELVGEERTEKLLKFRDL
jgi:hypothetical protein